MKLLVCFVLALTPFFTGDINPALAANEPVPSVSVTFDTSPLPFSPGYHLLKASAHVATGETIPLAFGLYLPRAYFQSKERLPIVMTLHNGGINGADGNKMLIFEGLAMMVAKDEPDNRGGGDKPANVVNLRADARFIVLIPQCPNNYGWESPLITRIMDDLITRIASAYHADADRVYLTGFSYGGSSTWAMALQLPDRFAAIVPIDGRATHAPLTDVAKLKHLGIYLAVGSADGGFVPEAERMHDALVAAKHPDFVYHVIHNGNHWGYGSVYADAEFWKWLFAHHRGAGPATRPSVAPSVVTVDAAAPEIRAATTMPSGSGILCQYWRDIPGARVIDLTDDRAYPLFPTEQVVLSRMEIPANQTNYFGTVLHGLLHAPVTGDYTFYIASDNQSELWLSTSDEPRNLARIASVPDWSLPRNWTQDPHQQSKPVHLMAGKSYFIEARHKNADGDNHLAVAWKLPDGAMEGPIPASRLSPAAAVDVPVPALALIEPRTLPDKPGSYRMRMGVDYQGRHLVLPLLLVLPRQYDGKQKCPLLVSPVDTDEKPDAEGFRTSGPPRELAGNAKLAAWSPLIVISLQCTQGQTWEQVATQRIAAAIIQRSIETLPVDPQRVYLTGSGAGATAIWKIAPLLPGKFAEVVPFCGLEVKDPRLPAALEGTKVHIITGVLNGMATDCAHRMKDQLAAVHPEPDIVFEMNKGSEVSDAYFASEDFYLSLLNVKRTPPKL